MLHRFAGLLLPSLILAAPLRAEGLPGPARQLFDAYLAQAARTMTSYRTEIRIGNDPKDADPRRLSGESAYLGRFTYRPVTYAELSRAERARGWCTIPNSGLSSSGRAARRPGPHPRLISRCPSRRRKCCGVPRSSSSSGSEPCGRPS